MQIPARIARGLHVTWVAVFDEITFSITEVTFLSSWKAFCSTLRMKSNKFNTSAFKEIKSFGLMYTFDLYITVSFYKFSKKHGMKIMTSKWNTIKTIFVDKSETISNI